jgi:hypothetical protein
MWPWIEHQKHRQLFGYLLDSGGAVKQRMTISLRQSPHIRLCSDAL